MLVNLIKKNFYRDSVYLMSLSNKIKIIGGVIDASVMMGTEANKKLLTETGFFSKEGELACPNDLLICMSLKTGCDLKKISDEIEKLFDAPSTDAENRVKAAPQSVEDAIELQPNSNMAVISIPGGYVKYQAEKLLKKGANLMIFSDNVPVETEIHLKKIGAEKGLLVMGPDCGTAIINGVPLGFANMVRKGGIGIVGASGTGIQEVTTIIHKKGEGITQAIGLGGRDLSKDVGGLMMLEGIKMLEADSHTKIICVISKPPAAEIEKKVLDFIGKCKKPFVINFIGGNTAGREKSERMFFASTLEDAALKAISVLKGKNYFPKVKLPEAIIKDALGERKKIKKGQKYLRGLFSGGTLCDEAMFILSESLGGIYSNIAVKPELKLKNSRESFKNSFIDLGDDEFTRGVPHPMIDFTVRNKRLVQEAKDKEVAVILFDLVLGYGAHPDPAGAILPALTEAQDIAGKQKRYISFVTSICGTEQDPQNLTRQKEILEKVGVKVLPSNATAARFTEVILNG